MVLLLNQSCGFWQGERRKTGFLLCFGSAPYSPVPPLILELLPFLLMKLCKGFCDLLEFCWEAFSDYLFFLPVLGVGMLWKTGEPVLSALCTTGVVCS